MKKKIGLLVLLIVVIGVGKYVYDIHLNHNFETITEGKVYKSGVIPPDEIESYVKKHNIKSIVDLRMPGTNDLVLNPEQPGELQQEREAVAKIKGVNYYSNPSDQVPTQEKVDSFLKIMDNPDNYPVLIHCYHGTGRAEMYSALYRIEYENMDRDEARERTRFLTKWSSFDLGKPKGDYLHTYETRKEKAAEAKK